MLSRTARNALHKPPFRFQGCLHVKQKSSRSLSRAAVASTKATPASSDDIALVSLFDQPRSNAKVSSIAYTGIFGHHSLTTPASFATLADSTLLRAQLLTERILRARESREELFKVVKNLDRLSDMLCSVIDLAELIRNAHPDREWVESANMAYEKMCEFMNVLNTHVELYDVRLIHLLVIYSSHLSS